MRFLHTADWQIGMTRHFLDADAQARFTAARIDAIRRLGALAGEQGCEFVVVCGDVFETNQLSRQTVGRALEALATVPVPVYLLPGNHDPLDPVTIYRSPQFVRDCPPHVHVLTSAEPVVVRDGVELIPAPWSGKSPGRDLVGAAVAGALGVSRMPSAGSENPIRIVVGHGAVDVLDPDRANPAAIALAPLEQELAAGRIHYVALGDRHSRTSVGSSGAVWYSGAPEPTAHREELPGDVLVVDLEHGEPPVVTPQHVGTWSFRTVRRELAAVEDVAALGRDLAAVPDKDRTVLRLALRGVLGVAAHADLADLLEEQGEVFAALYAWDRHSDVRVSADDAELEHLGLGGFLSAAAEEMQQLALAGVVDVADGAPDADPNLATDADPDLSDGATDADPDLSGPDPLVWVFSSDPEPDAQSATDALALLHRFSREVTR